MQLMHFYYSRNKMSMIRSFFADEKMFVVVIQTILIQW